MRVGYFALVGATSLGLIAACENDGPVLAAIDPAFQYPDASQWNLPDGSPPPPVDAAFPPTKSPLTLGATVSAEKAPPPITGGTLAITRDGKLAVAADPDRDSVHIVDLTTRAVVDIALNEYDEPSRVVEDTGGRAHVVLRRGGAIATIDLTTKTLLERRAVCAAPRGIAHEPTANVLYVACAGGELVTLPAATGAPTRTVRVERDLRDVVVRGTQLFVSTFRTARLLELGADGAIKVARTPATPDLFSGKLGKFVPHVAWRTINDPAGGVLMLHQRSRTLPVSTAEGGYGSGGACFPTLVQSTTTGFDTGTTSPPARLAFNAAVLPVDIALSPDGTKIAIVAAGNAKLPSFFPQVQLYDRSVFEAGPEECTKASGGPTALAGEIIAVAFSPDGKVVSQSREPALLNVDGAASIPLSTVSRADTGHAVFHANTGSDVSCASCHPEGGDDGHVWDFIGIGPRRTQTFRGGLVGTEPLHWDGDMVDVRTLMVNVFGKRMGGVPLTEDQVVALTKWVDKVPTVPLSAPADAAAVTRGAALFADATVGCAGCHNGKHLTNNLSVDVGTGKAFQVPSLRGIAWRAPYMHNGCAPTLLDRFGVCGGGDMHGKTSTLTDAQRKDLVAYLETL